MRLIPSQYLLILALLACLKPAGAAQPDYAAAVQETQNYIIKLSKPGIAMASDSAGIGSMRELAKSRSVSGNTAAQNYLQSLQLQREQVLADAIEMMGHGLQPKHQYQALLNGFSVRLTASEAAEIASLPGVIEVEAEQVLMMHLDTGPGYIGAPAVWNGINSPASRGENVVVGIIDSGINWDHPFFAGTAEDGYVHNNPLGQFFGLCNNPQFPEVQCNNKLIGVYDFTDEADQNGFDTAGHGSHVASIAVGNPLTRTLSLGANGLPVEYPLSGVAPRANLITYKVCLNTNPNNPGAQPGCPTAGILAALDQALLDGVDIVNLSLGADVPDGFTPWLSGFINLELLDLREAGILSVVSAGNSGSQPGTVTTPAHSPWSMAAGNITHDRVLGNPVTALNGGNTSPPQDVFGAGRSAGIGPRAIVHASDFGNALCGQGPAELAPTCEASSGASNPFPPGTFNGEIVVCDRGTYGRVEKGFNLLQAGAGGYILANTDSSGEDIVDDQHCLPGVHIGDSFGDQMRNWLASGSNHNGRIGSFGAAGVPAVGAQLAFSSSRGPNSEIAGVLKPNVVAPGTNIIGALNVDDQFQAISGTSMAAPHTAGAAALIMGARPGWSIDQVISALETTAVWPVPGSVVDPEIAANERGAGVLNAGQAVRAGLFLPVNRADFLAADPAGGGDPGALNLAGVQLVDCVEQCSTVRTLQDQMGGGSWQISADQPFLSVSPSNINFAADQQRNITISAELTDANLVGSWQTANIIMTTGSAADGQPLTQRLPVAVLFSGGALPQALQITTSQTRGRVSTSIDGLVAMDDATWQASMLVQPVSSTGNLQQDPTRNDPYDNNIGRRVELLNVPEGTLQVRVETLTSTATDIDLYVGRDLNGNGQADPFEEQCASLSVTDLEECEFDMPEAGTYWILLQNWQASVSGTDNASARYAALSMPAGITSPNLFINAPARTENNADINLTLAWDAGTLQQNETYWGAVALGTSRATAGNIGAFSVFVERDAAHAGRTLPLFDGLARDISLPGNTEQDLVFIDVPDNATSLDVQVQGMDIELQAVRVAFDEAFTDQPLAAAAPQNRTFTVPSDPDGNINLNIDLPELLPGRWYLIPRNTAAAERSLNIVAGLSFDDSQPVMPRETAYARDGGVTRQGIDFGRVGNFYGALWFTFDENGDPMFFGSSAPVPTGGDRTFSGLLRTPVSDGSSQQQQPAGRVGITVLNENELIYSYDLLGESGSEMMRFLVNTTCPTVSGALLNVNGVWDIPPGGQGGVSMAVTRSVQGYLRYFFDAAGQARWVSARGDGSFAANPDGTVFQASGFCPLCDPVPTSVTAVGTYQHAFTGDNQGVQTIEFELLPPLAGGLDESVDISKLSNEVICR